MYTALFGADSESQESAPIRLEADGIRLMQSWVEAIKERISKSPEEERPVCLWFIGEVELHAETARRLEPGFGERSHIHPYSLEGRWMGYLGARGRSPVKRMMCIRWYPIIHSFPKRKRTCRVSGEGSVGFVMDQQKKPVDGEDGLSFRLMTLEDIPEVLVVEREAFTVP